MEALQISQKFAAEIKNQSIVNLINKIYRHNDFDFMKGYIQEITYKLKWF